MVLGKIAAVPVLDIHVKRLCGCATAAGLTSQAGLPASGWATETPVPTKPGANARNGASPIVSTPNANGPISHAEIKIDRKTTAVVTYRRGDTRPQLTPLACGE